VTTLALAEPPWSAVARYRLRAAAATVRRAVERLTQRALLPLLQWWES